jgi:hypothetical protein
MFSGGALAFVVLHGVVKCLDAAFSVFGEGFVSLALAFVERIARLVSGEDRGTGRGDDRDTRGRSRVPLDPDSIPPQRRVLEAAKGDAKKLREKHLGWLQWRAEHDVETILTRPKPAFEIVKAFYPHAFHGITKDGFAVHLEKPGRFGVLLRELRARGFPDPTRTVVEHVSFVMTYAFDTIDTREYPRGRMLRIVDMSRLDIGDTGLESCAFLRAMAHVSSIAFPERVHKVVVVNPPSVFGFLWRAFSPMLSQKTMARVRICRTEREVTRALLEDMRVEDIPREYGGECDCAGAKNGLAGVGSRKDSWKPNWKPNSNSKLNSNSKPARDGGGARLLLDCPSASCASCWRDSDAEAALWDRVRESNGGTLHGVSAFSGNARRTRRPGNEDTTRNRGGGFGEDEELSSAKVSDRSVPATARAASQIQARDFENASGGKTSRWFS